MTTASVIIPSYRGAERLPRLLTALAAQTTTDWEAIVVIDGDVDGSEEVVARYSHLPIRSVVFPENRGRVAALNAGHEAASGEVLIRCDDDLEPAPDYVQKHIDSHAEQEQGTIGIYLNVLPDTRYTAVYGAQADQLFRDAAYSADQDSTWQFWAGNASLTRDIWESIGPYDVRYRAYGWEDVDYGFRLHQAGIPVVIDRGLATRHHAAATSAKSRVQRSFHSGQARQLFDKIHNQYHSPPTEPSGMSLWNKAVRTSAQFMDYQRATRAAKVVDAVIGFVPTPVARKLIALCVEASALAGYESTAEPETDI